MAIEMPLWMDPNPATGVAPEYSARQDRGIIARLFTEGVEDVQAGMLNVAQRAAGANMTVEVAAGACYVAGDDVARQGTYRVVVTSTETVTIGAAPASNSRIDLVVLRVRDATALGGAAHGATVEVIAGVVAASPAAPAVPNTAIPLAQVLVVAGATSIQTSAITDRRAQAGANTLKVGTQPQPMTQAQRDALSGAELYDGRFIFNITNARLEQYLSGAWRAVGSCQVDVFTASGTWAKPAGAKMVYAWVCGAGGAGCTWLTPSNYYALGGGGGAVATAWRLASALPASASVTVGAPGTCPTANTSSTFNVTGSTGGYSAFLDGTPHVVAASGGRPGGQSSNGIQEGVKGVGGLPAHTTTPQSSKDGTGTLSASTVMQYVDPGRGGDSGGAQSTPERGTTANSLLGAGAGATAAGASAEHQQFRQGLTGAVSAYVNAVSQSLYGAQARYPGGNLDDSSTMKPDTAASRTGAMYAGDGALSLRTTRSAWSGTLSGGDGQVPGGGGGALFVFASVAAGQQHKGGDGARGEVVVVTIF